MIDTTQVMLKLRRFILSSGYRRASYWINEDSAKLIGEEVSGHYSRWQAAKVLQQGGSVTVDLGGYRQNKRQDPAVVVTIEDLK